MLCIIVFMSPLALRSVVCAIYEFSWENGTCCCVSSSLGIATYHVHAHAHAHVHVHSTELH